MVRYMQEMQPPVRKYRKLLSTDFILELLQMLTLK